MKITKASKRLRQDAQLGVLFQTKLLSTLFIQQIIVVLIVLSLCVSIHEKNNATYVCLHSFRFKICSNFFPIFAENNGY